ncbi:MAG: DUF268 domain-containing protein [Proteobacteria bacterium]|nr:DUF268 domain-containing protein [Pseudomonadota bacterium]
MLMHIEKLADKIPYTKLIRRKIAYYRAFRRFKKDFYYFKSLCSHNRFSLSWEDRYPCLNDATSTTGFDAHYVYHTAWAARVLARTHPVEHIDIGSSLYFAALVSAFVPVRFYDYRPAPLNLENLESGAADLLSLPFPDASVASLSCMHVAEHIGLGRYGDPLDPQGDLKAMGELFRILSPGGQLLFVAPVGGEARIQYNAHRVYTYHLIIEALSGLCCKEFALVTDRSEFLEHACPEDADRQRYGCWCWLFHKS